MIGPKIIKEKISKRELKNIVNENFETMVKVDVDVKKEIITVGGEWHSEGDELLGKNGSSREDVWGVNFYPWNSPEKRIEYISLINIKPAFGYRDMEIKDKTIKEKISSIVEKLLLNNNENLDV